MSPIKILIFFFQKIEILFLEHLSSIIYKNKRSAKTDRKKENGNAILYGTILCGILAENKRN